jgi:sulfoxide reductase heme-binding subunit YedZ
MNKRLTLHYLPVLLLVTISTIIFYINKGNRNTITFIAFASGFISLTILSISLILGTLGLIRQRKNNVSTYFRRDIGIMGGFLALCHSITGLFVHLRGKTWLYFLNKTDNSYAIRLDNFGLANYTGLIAALLILVLIVTSNDFMLRKLKPVPWKNIQRLAYFMYAFIMVHCYFYRIGNKNHDVFLYYYIPILFVVIAFQAAGIILRHKKVAPF